MSKKFIYLTGILALLIAAVSAQENMTESSDAPMNNTTLNATLNITAPDNASLNDTASDLALNDAHPDSTALNNTIQNLTQNDAVMNETDLNASNPVLNITMPENANATVEPASNATVQASEPEIAPIQPSENAAFAIGSGLQPERVFVVNGNAKPKGTFVAGLSIKPLRDVSKMVFVCDII